MQDDEKERLCKILKDETIVVRRRFPNFVCDGRPLGDDPELYMHRFVLSKDFVDIEWVKELTGDPEFSHFSISDSETGRIIAEFKDEKRSFFVAVLEKGDLEFPACD